MSVPPPENSTGPPTVLDRVKTDRDIRAGLSTLKRVIIQGVVSALSFVVSTWIAFELELWLHHLELKAEESQVPIAPLVKVVFPYITGLLMMGLSLIATVKAFQEAWHIGGPHGGDGDSKEHSVKPLVSTPDPPIGPLLPNRADRRRKNRR